MLLVPKVVDGCSLCFGDGRMFTFGSLVVDAIDCVLTKLFVPVAGDTACEANSFDDGIVNSGWIV